MLQKAWRAHCNHEGFYRWQCRFYSPTANRLFYLVMLTRWKIQTAPLESAIMLADIATGIWKQLLGERQTLFCRIGVKQMANGWLLNTAALRVCNSAVAGIDTGKWFNKNIINIPFDRAASNLNWTKRRPVSANAQSNGGALIQA